MRVFTSSVRMLIVVSLRFAERNGRRVLAELKVNNESSVESLLVEDEDGGVSIA